MATEVVSATTHTLIPSLEANPAPESTPSASSAAKRAQVPKACGNCRKMHAGCDNQRPCRRCKQNGLEATCIDIPRKKRVSKKKQKTEHEETHTHTHGTPSQTVPKIWDDAFHELFGTAQQANLNVSPPMFGEVNVPSESTGLTPDFVVSPTTFATPRTPATPQISAGEITFLIQQITELKDSNRMLESKLSGVTQELGELKTNPGKTPVAPSLKVTNLLSPQPQASPAANSISPWHSFQPQRDLAISVWKNVGYCSNVLVECNDKFVELLGYPIETLKSNFTCSKLIKRDSEKQSSREWPKRTQIVTAEGLKDVFLTINPVSDQQSVVRYYVLHILEVHS